MSQSLFSIGKVGLFLDAYQPGIEKRRDEDVAVLKLTLRVQPFDSKLATAIDDGLGGDTAVRAALFKLNHPDPKPHLERLEFSLGCPRQTLSVYAAPDAPEARIAFTQAKITGTYARTQKDENGFAFVLKATFGPVGRDELEFVHAWYRTQRFVTFEASEPALWDEPDDDEADLDDAPIGEPVNGRGEIFGADPEPFAPNPEPQEPSRPIKTRGAKKGRKKVDHDRERSEQAADARARAH